jgi:curved DNA-binding protein CbpA
MSLVDYYEILQVHPRADAAAIAAAYRRLADLYDPQRLAGAADELIAIAQQKRADLEAAYAVLSDPARRAAYDAERASAPVEATVEAGTPGEEIYDYRPLPPATRAERDRKFNDQPVIPAARSGYRPATLALVAVVVAVAVLLPALMVSVVLTNAGMVQAPSATATPSPLDSFETLIAQARTVTEQEPENAQAWVDYANLLYDSAQIVREQAPESVLYQQRLPRWLEAIEAYRRALEIVGEEPRIRGEIGASACFYGAGVGDLRYIEEGLAEMQVASAALPDDIRILLNLGFCRANAQPPQIDAAIADWQRVVELAPPESAFAIEAQRLIQQYRSQ